MIENSQFGLLTADDHLWAKKLIDAGVKLSHTDAFGSNCLHLAARRGNLKLVMVLVRAGANPNSLGFNSWYYILIRTPLHEASSYAHIEIVHYLIFKGADISIVNSNGETPKDVASNRGFDTKLLDTLFSQTPDQVEFVKMEKSIQIESMPSTANMLGSPKVKSDKAKFGGLYLFSRDKTEKTASPSSSASSLTLSKSVSMKRSFFSKAKSNSKSE